MGLLTIFMGIGLVFALATIFLLNNEVAFFKKKQLENKSDIKYFKNSYIKYYDKYVSLTQPELITLSDQEN